MTVAPAQAPREDLRRQQTTTLRILLGLIAPGAGSATFGGHRYFVESIVGGLFNSIGPIPAVHWRDDAGWLPPWRWG